MPLNLPSSSYVAHSIFPPLTGGSGRGAIPVTFSGGSIGTEFHGRGLMVIGLGVPFSLRSCKGMDDCWPGTMTTTFAIPPSTSGPDHVGVLMFSLLTIAGWPVGS